MRAMSLAVEVEPAEAGFDAQRLERIDRHFGRYVDDGRLPGWLAVVARDGRGVHVGRGGLGGRARGLGVGPRAGRVVHVGGGGLRDMARGLPVEPDTVWRIYSMPKPVTSVAAMMLYEEGAFELKDPVAKFIPAFGNARVWAGGTQLK